MADNPPSLVTYFSDTFRCELELYVSKIKELSRDIFYIRDVFMRSLQKKEEIEGEALSLVRNFQVMKGKHSH